MALAPQNSAAMLTAAAGIDQFLEQRYSNFAANRQPLEEKWQRNYDDMHRLTRQDETWKSGETEEWRSKTYIGITYQKVMAAFAVICDAVLVGGKIPFTTKIDDAFGDAPEGYWDAILDARKEQLDSQIEDTGAERATMRLLLSMLVYGEGWWRREVRSMERQVWSEAGSEYMDLAGADPSMRRFDRRSVNVSVPTFRYVSPWAMFWDTEVEDLEDGCGLFCESFLSPYRVQQLAKLPFIDRERLASAVKLHAQSGASSQISGRSSNQIEPRLRDQVKRDHYIRVREYWGLVPQQYVEQWPSGVDPGVLFFNESGDAEDEVMVTAYMVGDQTVGLARVRKSDNPFGRVPATDDIDAPGKIGIADNLEQIQRVINGAVRAFEDNKRLSANVILAKQPAFMEGENQTFTPGKDIIVSDSASSVKDAIQQVIIQDVGESLMSVISLFLQFADEESGVPKQSQGMPDPNFRNSTATEITERAEKAQKFIGTIIRNLDEYLIEPVLTWMLELNMLDQASAHLSAPLHIQALGFSSFQSRVVKLNNLRDWMALIMNDPTGELRGEYHIKKIADEIARIMDLDPVQFEVTEEEKAQRAMADRQAQLEAAGLDGGQGEAGGAAPILAMGGQS
jgi:hypothetical protein